MWNTAASYTPDPVMLTFGPLELWWYGAAYAAGLLAVDAWVRRRRKALDINRAEAAGFSLLFAAGVLVGGRMFDVFLYEWGYYREHPWQIPRLWEGGMATHGVMLGAAAGAAIFCRLRGKSLLAVADEVVVPATVLMALGRLGNHINGEVFGTLTEAPWAMRFPYAEGCRHPVALYDGLKNLLVLPILLWVGSGYHRRGVPVPRGLLFGHFLLWYGGLRVFVDLFREYDSYWLGIGRGQFFNVVVALAGLCVILAARKLSHRTVTASASPDRRPLAFLRVAFYAIVVFCLLIPSGWTQQVLEGFAQRGDGVTHVELCRYDAGEAEER